MFYRIGPKAAQEASTKTRHAMGNSLGYESYPDEEDGIVDEIKGRYDYTKIYWDIDGNLRYGVTNKNRDEEVS